MAGFTGVVAAFGRSGGESWSAADISRFTAMIGASFSALLYALLPFLLSSLGFSEGTIWRLGSTAIALELAVIVAVRSAYDLLRHGSEVLQEASRVLLILVSTLVAVVTATQVLNALGSSPGEASGRT